MSCCSQQRPRSWGPQTGGLKVRLPARPPPTAGKDVPQLWAPEAGTVRALCALSFNTWTPRP